MTLQISLSVPHGFSTIAVISDLHANGPATEAVFEELPADAYVVCLGDLVGYYTEPDEVCRKVQSRAHVTIRGNHDAYVIGVLEYPGAKEDDYRIEWTRSRLTQPMLDWLSTLPIQVTLALDESRKLIVRHANLENETDYIYPDTPCADLSLADGETLLIGHTHHPMLRECGKGRIVNPGSVGQPRNYRPGAAYALVDRATGDVSFEMAAYDIQNYQTALHRSGISEKFVSMLDRRK